jgi:ribonucleoside-diphosphate reductase alpha chain
VDVADICCYIAQAIVSGGSRRSALIVLFSYGDTDMLDFKSGDWWDTNIQRAKANISEINVRSSKTVVESVDRVIGSKTGEPALVLVHSVSPEENTGCNPCNEASLRNHSFCNLCEVILPACKSESDMLFAARSASFFGTLQAGFTDLKYVKEDWSTQTKKDALLGVSVTGCAQMPKFITASLLEEAVIEIKKQNRATASKIGINPAARLTVLKPSGSTSCVMECTSGIHAAHGEYIVRRVRVTKISPLGLKLVSMFGISPIIPTETEHGTHLLPMDKYSFIVHEAYGDKDIVLQFPCHYQGAIYRKNESSVELLERAAWFRKHWIVPGHVSGQETNNVSLTVSHRPEEKEEIIAWMLNNQDKYRGISVLPDDCTAYPLLPFEEISKEEFDRYYARFPDLNFEELGISSNVQGTSACSGGGCEINSL